jgi:hypothetical protein
MFAVCPCWGNAKFNAPRILTSRQIFSLKFGMARTTQDCFATGSVVNLGAVRIASVNATFVNVLRSSRRLAPDERLKVKMNDDES